MLCGVAPIPASPGKTTRHRLNRGERLRSSRSRRLGGTVGFIDLVRDEHASSADPGYRPRRTRYQPRRGLQARRVRSPSARQNDMPRTASSSGSRGRFETTDHHPITMVPMGGKFRQHTETS